MSIVLFSEGGCPELQIIKCISRDREPAKGLAQEKCSFVAVDTIPDEGSEYRCRVNKNK